MIEIIPSGDSIIILKDLKNLQSSILSKKIEKLNLLEIEDIISLKNSIGVLFNPYKTKSDRLIKKIQRIIKEIKIKQKHDFRTWKIPICYDEEFAIDKKEISEYTRLDFEEIKQKHLNKSYDVQIIGFLPGFLYLGDIDKSINIPRKHTPRSSIPEGSVAIAGNQTGIYNINSPGGWNIIGKTPLKLFDKSKNPPIDIYQGDKIIFHEIKKGDFKNY
jgi:inhibitor of KinA